MNNKRETIIIAGGGTGGHIIPAVSIALELKEFDSIYIGSKYGIESKENLNDNFKKKYFLDITGIQRNMSIKSVISNLLFPIRFFKTYFESRKIISRHKPKIVIGTGGYCSGLPLLAGIHMKVPTLIQDQNSVPGLITKKLHSKINKICIAYEEFYKYINNSNIKLTGNPINPSLKKNINIDKNFIKKKLGLSLSKKTILILGGSQGAQSINKHIYSNYNYYKKNNYQIILQCGERNYNSIPTELFNEKNITIKKFLKDEKKWSMLNCCIAADLVIARAGALTISELTYLGKASILIPYKYASENHQEINAKSLQKKGACIIVDEDKLRKGTLEKKITEIFRNKTFLNLEKKALNAAYPNAIKDIIQQIKKILNEAN